MAKELQALAHLVPFHSVCWFKDYNLARKTGNYGTPEQLKEVKDLLVKDDWLLNDNGMIQVEDCPAHYIERCVRERQEMLDALTMMSKQQSDKVIEVEVFKTLYCDPKGKILRPDYIAISGNRRSSQVFQAKVERRRTNLPIGNQLPVIILEFKSPLERLEAQLRENEDKTAGYLEIGNMDRLLAAKTILEMGGKEADVTRVMTTKRGTAQKVWGVVKLDKRWPKVGIINRMALPPEDEQFIGWGVNKEELRKLSERSDPESLAKINKGEVASGKPLTQPATQEEVERYFLTPKGVDGNQKKVTERSVHENLRDNNPARVTREHSKAHLTNNTDIIDRYRLSSTGFNALDDLIDSGDYPPVELLLTKIINVKGQERIELLKRLIDVAEGKVNIVPVRTGNQPAGK